jgi:dipeptidyl aminopeptidase/acylaminoacyl peptidase
MSVSTIVTKQLATPSGPLSMRQVSATIDRPGGRQQIELWMDASHHLTRLIIPADGLTVIREDLTSIAIRELRAPHPGDEDVFIPATGFALAATLTRPAPADGRVPAIVLVGQPSATDRDEVTDEVPIFGHLAGALADAGFAVVRFDRRGTGQSGGRIERATLDTYAGDAVHVVTWLRRRKDIDADRLAVLGYGEGGPVALLAAAREKRLKAIVLAGSPGRTGREVVLQQQEQELAVLPLTSAERAERAALQRRIIDALTMGGSWEGVPADIRADADTPWFRSWLAFDPALVMKRVNAPILILHGAADTRIPPAHADALETLARARRRPPTETRKVVPPDVTHLLASDTAGPASDDQALSPEVVSAIVTWLRDTLGRR